MNFIVAATTDIGLTKQTNQDSHLVRVFSTVQGKIAFAVLCDGMGGLAKGEVASSSLIKVMMNWSEIRLPVLCEGEIRDEDIRSEWCDLITRLNDKIKSYGKLCGANMGTTIAAILITEKRFYVLNVGDSRVYQIDNAVKAITKDQTLVAREVEMGNLTEEQAEHDPRRSVLLQCVGASDAVYPDMFFGQTKENTVYMLCSDGFRHEISNDEIFNYLNPYVMNNSEQMNANMQSLVELNKQRHERDNITVITIRTF